jgi:hypothetical protein
VTDDEVAELMDLYGEKQLMVIVLLDARSGTLTTGDSLILFFHDYVLQK